MDVHSVRSSTRAQTDVCQEVVALAAPEARFVGAVVMPAPAVWTPWEQRSCQHAANTEVLMATSDLHGQRGSCSSLVQCC